MHMAIGRQSTRTLPLQVTWAGGARNTVESMLTTTERLARYETAQEIIGMMIALRSEWIGQERAKPVPDASKIQAWLAEQDLFAAEEDALTMDDGPALERVLREYGPVVRASLGG